MTQPCDADVCLTCSDEGRPAEVIRVPEDPFGPARVTSERGQEDVDVSLVGTVRPGDRVLVHAGVAIARLDRVGSVA
ncbi:MAG: HypC/HybG/HupF family hydrogenase formation chaperone [Actinomycetia bacterium]|nr:HypC/HybG/HupF family hydrogenase formation chaperone [Actinomycetes bacterium]